MEAVTWFVFRCENELGQTNENLICRRGGAFRMDDYSFEIANVCSFRVGGL